MNHRRTSYKSYLRYARILGVIALIMLFSGCEALFTTNIFENFARDPENMSEEQLVAYGNEAVASGNRDRMTSAFEALSAKVGDRDLSDDPDTRNTLVELGLGVTDIVSVVRESIEDPTGVSEQEFDAERREIARRTADIMLEADSEDFEPDRWAYAAAGVGLAALGDGDGWEEVDWDEQDQIDSEDRDRVEALLEKSLEGYEREGRTDSETFTQIDSLYEELTESGWSSSGS